MKRREWGLSIRSIGISSTMRMPYKFVADLTALLASIVTIFGLPVFFLQLQVTNLELKNLNARAKIEVQMTFGTSSIEIGQEVSEPIDISVIPRNIGEYTPTQWRMWLMFCKNVQIVEEDRLWLKQPYSQEYVFESFKPLISKKELGLFFESLDKIGSFKIRIPTKNNYKLENKIPIALAASGGERTETYITMISMDKEQFYYDELLIDNGNIISPDVSACAPIIERVNNKVHS